MVLKFIKFILISKFLKCKLLREDPISKNFPGSAGIFLNIYIRYIIIKKTVIIIQNHDFYICIELYIYLAPPCTITFVMADNR